MKTLPVKILGPHVTFSAVIEQDGLPVIFEQCWTVTDPNTEPLLGEDGKPVKNAHGDTVLVTNGATSRDAVKDDIAAFSEEFALLVAERDESLKTVDPKQPIAEATYFDPVSGDKLTKKQAESAFKDAFPEEEV